MARWYKTASPKYEDFMYELPKEAILKAVQTADAGITANSQSNEALKGLLKLNSVKKDQTDANRILTGYEAQINSLAKEIQSDPLQYRRKSSKIGDLQRTIARDFQNGDAAMIQNNYNTRLANYEAMKEDYKKNPEKYNYQDIEKLQGRLDNSYGGYRSGAYGVDRLREFVDLKEFDKLGKDYAAEIIERTGAFKGADGYLYTSESMNKRIDPNQIKKDLVQILTSDKKLNDYYRQQIELGNITEEQYMNNLADTANRIGEKYGFLETKSGLTSIKNDDISTQEAAYLLANAQTNATPDTIAAGDTVADKYSNDPTNVNNNTDTVYGMYSVINVVSGKVQSSKNMATSLAKENGIIIPTEYAREIQKGNFSVLKNLKGANGEKISNQEIYKLQQEHDSYVFDRKLMQQKVEIANKQKDPDAWLKKSKGSMLEVIGDFQKYGIVQKSDQVQFTKGVAAVQKELDETQGWYNAPVTFSSETLEQMPGNIRAKLRNGMTINELISNGDIKVKQTTETVKVKVPKLDSSGKPLMANGKPVMVTEERVNTNPTSEYHGFKVNAKHAKPTITPNGEGKALWQFEINYQGHPIQTYIEDKHLSNKGLDRFMNKDAMKAAYQFRKAQSEGVIDEDGFNISGVQFKEVNGRIVAKTPSGTVPPEDAIQMIGAYYKNQREKTLR